MFFIVKLLAFLPFGNIMRGPLGKFIIGGMIVAAAAIGFKTWLYMHDSNIRKVSTLEFNQSQIQQNIKDQKVYQNKITNLLIEQKSTLTGIVNQRDILQKRTDDIIKRINDGQYKGGVSTDVLQQTIKELKLRRTNSGN